MAGRLGRDHDDVEVSAWLHLTVMHVEAVGERQRSALFHMGLDRVAIDLGDVLVGHEHHHHVGAFDGLFDLGHFQTGFFRLVPGRAVLAQSHGDLHSAVIEVLCMGMALRAITHDGDFLALDEREVGVFVVIHVHVGSW
ncbi:hypothetical protein GALL_486730 [mine drainage metagenome]|uniref:Uncharacterized protein n=1 Tax=mine drainage metagenome TaxID=410659 RepID=A0A1J5Q1H5_9ZZZZ